MRDVLADVDAWTARGDKVALAMVVGVKRSAPRPPGAKMAINSRGESTCTATSACSSSGRPSTSASCLTPPNRRPAPAARTSAPILTRCPRP